MSAESSGGRLEQEVMSKTPRKSVQEIASELGRYSIDAFEFLHEGLDYTVRKIHGPPNPMADNILKWLRENGIEPESLESVLEDVNLPAPVQKAIEQAGGSAAFRERLNRHVGGEELCWGLRDLALEKWGVMASAVLASWGIRATKDFGRLVFALVENDLLQKQPDDRIEDFENVYQFDKAFNGTYKISLTAAE